MIPNCKRFSRCHPKDLLIVMGFAVFLISFLFRIEASMAESDGGVKGILIHEETKQPIEGADLQLAGLIMIDEGIKKKRKVGSALEN